MAACSPHRMQHHSFGAGAASSRFSGVGRRISAPQTGQIGCGAGRTLRAIDLRACLFNLYASRGKQPISATRQVARRIVTRASPIDPPIHGIRHGRLHEITMTWQVGPRSQPDRRLACIPANRAQAASIRFDAALGQVTAIGANEATGISCELVTMVARLNRMCPAT